ncbi:MAG TPA: hypothetical protein VNW97_14650 [Candidatus Saccharimonadales bacterium]|nr:hypothetical protein [Candidatus Saccharimonadales bacterium]
MLARQRNTAHRSLRAQSLANDEWLVYSGHSSIMLTLDHLLTLISFSLEGALIAILLYRRLQRTFRLFVAFIICTMSGDLLLFSLTVSPRTYFILYWVINAINSAVALAVIIDLFRDALQLVYSKLGVLGFLLPMVIFGLITVLFWGSLHRHHFYGRSWQGFTVSIIYSFGLGISLLEAGICVLSLWLGPRYRIWDRRSLSVIAGLGLIGLATLIVFIVRIEFGTRFTDVFRYVPFFSFVCATLIWISIFLPLEPESDRRRPDMENVGRFLELATRRLEDLRRSMRRWGLRFHPV